MVHLFVAPAPYEGWGECPYDGTNLSQLLAAFIVIVSISPLAVTLCLSLALHLISVMNAAPAYFNPSLCASSAMSEALGRRREMPRAKRQWRQGKNRSSAVRVIAASQNDG